MSSIASAPRPDKAAALVREHLANRAAHLITARVNASGVNTWLVRGHVVTLEPRETCDCQDHTYRHVTCKHILAVRMLAASPAVAPTRPARSEWVEEV